MAEAHLNFDESALDKESNLYKLYTQLYNGMKEASQVTPPDFASNPPTTPDGQIDSIAIENGLAEYSTILMKNSAYLFASTISGTYPDDPGSGEGGEGEEYLLKTGDDMLGPLTALKGFQAGVDGHNCFTVSYSEAEGAAAYLPGKAFVGKDLTVDKDVYVGGTIHFNNEPTIYYSQDALHIDSSSIYMHGELNCDGEFHVGDIAITSEGIYNNDHVYYHAGNSNISTVDWQSRDMMVHNDLSVTRSVSIGESLTVGNGFDFRVDNTKILYSVVQDNSVSIEMRANLNLGPENALQLDGHDVLFLRKGVEGVVSLSAPGMVLNLGDSSQGTSTQHIALQADIKHYSNTYSLISKDGDGCFLNSLRAGHSNSVVLDTYYNSSDDYGVRFYNRINMGDDDGTKIYYDALSYRLVFDNMHWRDGGETQIKERVQLFLSSRKTTSLFKDISQEYSSTFEIGSSAEFIAFSKPVEVSMLSIISEQYKTSLQENTLFFNDGCFLEGMTDGIRHSGNAYFDGNLGSKTFASGYAGYGWAIQYNQLYGGYAVTVDEITVRRKMRIYELEVQKQSYINGSFWISSSCSGDYVEEV